MTHRKSPTLVLEQMLEAAQRAMSYIEGYDEQDFLADRRTQDAVSLQLIVIGEMASKQLRNPAMLVNDSDLPFRQMLGMRNRIAHGYREIDMLVVWDTTKNVLPDFATTLANLIEGALSSGAPQPPFSTGDQ